MPIPHKYKTGETVIANGTGQGEGYDGELAIIVASRLELGMYYDGYYYSSVEFDESCSDHIYYYTYSLDRKYFWWYWEPDVDSYCSNTERGKSILRQILLFQLFSSLKMNTKNAEKFMEDFF